MIINEPQTLEQIQVSLGELPGADLPIALFPVRLETRFVVQAPLHTLCVRVFPDELHVETHEPGLTPDEESWGKHLWTQAWRSGGDAAAGQALRDELARRFGPGRGAWIARVLAPLNPEDRPREAIAETDPLPAAPEFPDIDRKDEAWTRAPRARAMPDRWVVMGYRGDARVLTAVGRPIPETLAAGPDPGAPPPAETRDEDLGVDNGMRWMVDFDRAVEDGMGLRIPISREDADAGYDRLMVLGLKARQDGAAAAEDVESLLEAQHYTDSLAFVPQGTPSNNTAEAKSGYAGSEPWLWTAFAGDGNAEAPVPESNGSVTARALGLDPAVFERIPHAVDAEQADARALNAALWPATWGYFLHQVMGGALADDAIERTRRHFIDHVRARGPLPALRVGRQPYGILPVTALDRFVPADGEAFDARGLDLLRALRTRWQTALARLPHVRPMDTRQDMEQNLADILGLRATTDHIQLRMAIDGALYGLRRAEGLEASPGPTLQKRKEQAMELLRKLGISPDVPGASMVFTEPVLRLTDRLAAAQASAPDGPLDPDYITEIRKAGFAALRDEQLGAVEETPAVLYLLLRHAMLLAYAEAGYRIQVAEGILQPGAFADPGLVDILSAAGASEKEPEHTLTPLRLLDATVPKVGDAPLRDLIHRLGGADHPGAAILDEMRKSLEHLAAVPATRLDGLLRETLDLASHRLDAWITSLATARLVRLRRRRPSGLLVGGYGWVQNLRMAGSRERVTDEPPGEAASVAGPLYTVADNGGYVAAPSLPQASAAAILRSGYLAYADDSATAPFAVDLSSDRVRLAQWLLDGVRQGQPLSALLGYRFERALRESGLARYIRPFRLVAPFGKLYETMAEKAALEDEKADLIRTYQDDRAARVSAIEDLKRQVKSLDSQIKSMTAQSADLRSQIKSLDSQIQKKQDAVDNLIQQANAKQKEVDRFAKLAGSGFGGAIWKQKLQKAQAELQDINRKLSQAKNGLQSLKNQRADKQRQVNSLASQIKARTRDRQTTRNRISDKQGELAALDTAHAAALAALQQQIDAVQVRIEALEADFRAKYTATASLQAMEAVEVQHVVDGLALVRKWQAGTIPFGQTGLPGPGTPDAVALGVRLDALGAAVDAVSDLVTAEGVYQLVRGNTLRAGANLDAVARGETPPPEPEFVRTPRSMSAHTHRVAVLLSAAPAAPAAWPTDAFQRRAQAEPTLNAWIARLLPDPARVRIEATFRDPRTNEPLAGGSTRLDKFFLSPLDAVYLTGTLGPGSPLEALMAYRLLRFPPAGVPAQARVTFAYERGADWTPADVAFGEFLEVARAARELVTAARPLDARDLARPEAFTAANLDPAEMKVRADAAVNHFKNARNHLLTQLEQQDAAGTELDPLRNDIFRLLWLGIPEAVPRHAGGDDAEARRILLDQGHTVLAEAGRRIAALEAAEAAADRNALTPEGRVEHDIQRMQTVFGADFRVLPRFQPAEPETLAATFGRSLALQGQNPLAAVEWFQQIAHVRDGAARLSTSLTYAEAISAEAGMNFTVGQLPHADGDRWIALPHDSGRPPEAPRVSLVMQIQDGFLPSAPAAGLMIDEWVEGLPATRETAAVAFHFDAPAAQAPQSILLAVPPDQQPRWDLETLEAIVQETMELARLRAVDTAALAQDPEHGHLLPAIYLAFNPGGDTISTDMARAR